MGKKGHTERCCHHTKQSPTHDGDMTSIVPISVFEKNLR